MSMTSTFYLIAKSNEVCLITHYFSEKVEKFTIKISKIINSPHYQFSKYGFRILRRVFFKFHLPHIYWLAYFESIFPLQWSKESSKRNFFTVFQRLRPYNCKISDFAKIWGKISKDVRWFIKSKIKGQTGNIFGILGKF